MQRCYKTFIQRLIGCVVALTALLACDSPEPTAPVVRNASRLYAAARLNHKAIMLSLYPPYDTVQLHVVPISLTGDTLPDDGIVEFVRFNILDTSVQVDSTTGFVRAHTSTNSTRVIARLTIDGVTREDTAIIMIRPETPARRIARLEFAPPATDSSWRWAGSTNEVLVQPWIRLFDLWDSIIPPSQMITSLAVEKPEVFRSTGGLETGPLGWKSLIGETWLYTSVYAYGTALIDSVLFRRVDPPVRFVVVDRTVPAKGDESIAFYPGTVTAKVGSTIVFINSVGALSAFPPGLFPIDALFNNNVAGGTNRIIHKVEYNQSQLVWVDSVDIVFDDPDLAKPGQEYGAIQSAVRNGPIIADGSEGNIPAFAVFFCAGTFFTTGDRCGGLGLGVFDRGYRTRRFDTPGTYHYSSTRFPGARGTIIITE